MEIVLPKTISGGSGNFRSGERGPDFVDFWEVWVLFWWRFTHVYSVFVVKVKSKVHTVHMDIHMLCSQNLPPKNPPFFLTVARARYAGPGTTFEKKITFLNILWFLINKCDFFGFLWLDYISSPELVRFSNHLPVARCPSVCKHFHFTVSRTFGSISTTGKLGTKHRWRGERRFKLVQMKDHTLFHEWYDDI